MGKLAARAENGFEVSPAADTGEEQAIFRPPVGDSRVTRRAVPRSHHPSVERSR